jgi:hypothetical protein
MPRLRIRPVVGRTVTPSPTFTMTSWFRVLVDTLPLAVASPVHAHASPSEALPVAALLVTVSGPMTVVATTGSNVEF